MYVDSVYRNRRNILRHRMDEYPGVIWLQGNDYVGMNYRANPYPFVQDSNFLYFCGLERESLHLVIELDTGKSILFGDEYAASELVWTGDRPSLGDAAEAAAIDEVRAKDELQAYLQKIVHQGQTVHTLPTYRGDHLLHQRSFLGVTQDSSSPLIRTIVSLRSVKEDREVVEIEDALSITAEMHREAMLMAHAGVSEAQILGKITEIAVSHHARFAYSPIVTVNGDVLHKLTYENILAEGNLLLLDAGVSNAMGYASDITRTIPVGRRFDTRQKAVYQLVLDAQETAIELCSPGREFREIHKAASLTLIQGLKDLDILQGDAEEIWQQGAHALFFMHGLGHMIGMDVHDMEGLGEDLVGYGDEIERSEQFGLAYLRLAKKLHRGFVVTVEPGLYFVPRLIEKWASQGTHSSFVNYDEARKYIGFGGVRIEDNVLITKLGNKVLGPAIPKSVQEIESL